VIDGAFLEKWEIDYVAHDEDPYPGEGMEDTYAFVKSQGETMTLNYAYDLIDYPR
jgi:choline-phosphate cytidylyltransferase